MRRVDNINFVFKYKIYIFKSLYRFYGLNYLSPYLVLYRINFKLYHYFLRRKVFCSLGIPRCPFKIRWKFFQLKIKFHKKIGVNFFLSVFNRLNQIHRFTLQQTLWSSFMSSLNSMYIRKWILASMGGLLLDRLT